MGTITVSDTLSVHPSGYASLTNMTQDSTYTVDRGYTDSNSTTYARFNINTSSTGYLYYTFDTSDIPPTATITSVTAKAKARVSNTTRVTNTVLQLFTNTTAKGSNKTFASTTASEYTLSPGTWTRSEITNLRLKVGGTGSSSSSSKRIDFYGATVTINYTYQQTSYSIIISNSSSVEVTASADEVLSGGSVEITADSLTNLTITDNNTNVTSQFVEITSGTESVVPESNTNSNFTLTNIGNAYHGSDNTTYAQLGLGASTTGTIYFDFGDLSIPSGAIIYSISCAFTYQYNNNNSSSGYTASCQLYSGSTAKGSSSSLVSSGGTSVAKTTINLTPGTWSASDLSNARLYITATNSARSTQRYLYVYGATLTVTYEMDHTVYVYTISNVSADHTIVVTSSGSSAALYVKISGSWVQVTKAYKKVNGSWVEQADISTLFNTTDHFKQGT